MFVADAGNKIVYHFDRNGQLLNTIGEKDPEAGFNGFIIPSPHFDLAIGREGQLWVVNPGKHEFLAFNKNGELFSSWSRTSMQLDGFSGCCNPGNIALLPDGSFVTSEKGIERIKIHLPSGDYKCVVAGPDQFSPGTVHIDLAVNSKGRIYTLDAKSGIVKYFEENHNLTGLPPNTTTKSHVNKTEFSNIRPVRLTSYRINTKVEMTRFGEISKPCQGSKRI